MQFLNILLRRFTAFNNCLESLQMDFFDFYNSNLICFILLILIKNKDLILIYKNIME